MSPKRSTSVVSSTRAKLVQQLSERIIGQPQAIDAIVPRVQMFQAGLAPEGRPAGVFMLLGPTGVGKTETVQALAEVIHGSAKNVLRIDCGEYQMEHEVAKLIGAPPGYLGHRETTPVLTQLKLTQAMSERANVAIVLFDEIEKAAPSLLRLLLGVLDKGTLRLGDNTTVLFERTLIFFTSNLGGSDISRELGDRFGLAGNLEKRRVDEVNLEVITMRAVKRRLSPELINRIDAFITYRPLTPENVAAILDIQLQHLANHISCRLGDRTFFLHVPKATREWLIEKGYSVEYGARELKRTLDRHVLEPLADLVASGYVPAGAIVNITARKNAAALTFLIDDEELGNTGTLVSDNGVTRFIVKKGNI